MKQQSTIPIKVIFLSIVLCHCLSIAAFSQAADNLQGKWINEQGARKAEFYKQGEEYFGKIIWTSKTDDKVKVGDVVFKNLKWDGKTFSGTAATPMGEATCSIVFESDSKIKISISKGFMSRNVGWSRISDSSN